jgi:hypothetical protein
MEKKVVAVLGGVMLVALLAILQTGSGQTQGAWVPVIAKQKLSVYQDIAGRGRVLHSDEVGSYMRNREGSIYERRLRVQGEGMEPADTAILDNARDGKIYFIDYGSRTIRILQQGRATLRQPPTAESFRGHFSSKQWLGTKIIGTIECEGYETIPSGPGGIHTGEKWVAPSLNFLTIQLDTVDHEQNVEIVKTLEDVQTGQDPDPEYFLLPEGFKLGGPLFAQPGN